MAITHGIWSHPLTGDVQHAELGGEREGRLRVQGYVKIGEEVASTAAVLHGDEVPVGVPSRTGLPVERKDADMIALDAAATRLREVIALCGGTGRAPTRQHALVRSKAEEALLYALFGTYTGIDAT